MIPLAGRDAVIYARLRQIVAMGRHARTYAAHDVVRVANRHLGGNAHQRAVAAAHKRADEAEARAARLQERVVELEHNLLRHTAVALDELPPRRVVELNRSEYEAMAMFAEGQPREAIARELGLKRETISNYVSAVTRRCGADNAAEAAALINRNVVMIQAKERSKAA